MLPLAVSDLFEFFDVLEAVDALREMELSPDPFRVGKGTVGCATGFFVSAAGVSVGGGALTDAPRPGRGK